MPSVLQMRRVLQPTGEPSLSAGIRSFSGDDLDRWLVLREQAFADQTPPPRAWSATDFHRELTQKPWWRPDWCWLAEVESAGKTQLVGTVTLAQRPGPSGPVAAVHWLAVLPEFRRQGWGRKLLLQLEHTAWQAGLLEVWLETHAGWEAANRCYARLGYVIQQRA